MTPLRVRKGRLLLRISPVHPDSRRARSDYFQCGLGSSASAASAHPVTAAGLSRAWVTCSGASSLSRWWDSLSRLNALRARGGRLVFPLPWLNLLSCSYLKKLIGNQACWESTVFDENRNPAVRVQGLRAAQSCPRGGFVARGRWKSCPDTWSRTRGHSREPATSSRECGMGSRRSRGNRGTTDGRRGPPTAPPTEM